MAKKGGGTQTVTQQPDAATQAYVQQVRNAAQGAGNSTPVGVNPYTQQAAQQFGQFAQAGNLGIGALSGDANAMAQFQNPYTQSVVNSTMADQGRLRAQGMQGVDSDATMNGAFGGSRADVARGQYGSNFDLGTAQQLAQLRSSGFQNAQQTAMGVANLGMGATGQMANMGDYMRNVQMQTNPDAWRLGYLQQGLNTPQGQTQTTSGTTGHNWATGLLGGAGTGASVGGHFGPWGAGIGAGLGGLFGMFGGG